LRLELLHVIRNIHHACFCMLDELVPNQFKVSNTPTLTGWNSTMLIHEILTQLEDGYGKPSSGMLFATDNCFKSAFGANKAPELLFYHMEQCQEIMRLGKTPYAPEQIINTALRLLMASNIFPMNEFDKWETQNVKTYPVLKTFIHEAYTRHLNAMEHCNTSGQMGYAAQPAQHNMYNVLDNNDATKDSTVATIAAAATTGSTFGNTYAASNTHPDLSLSISAMIPPAFNQIAMNQTAFANQLAAMLMMQQPQQIAPTQQFSTPPIPNVAFPMQHPFPAPYPKQAPCQQQYRLPNQGYHNWQQGYFGGGRGRQSGGRGHVCGSSHGGRPRRPNFQQMQGGGTGPFAPPNLGGGTGPFGSQPQFQNNPINRYANWNACFSCGFDVEDGHTSATCPTFLRKHNPQVEYTCDNVAAYAAYEPYTKGRHKMQLPNM
jgi:hypothetical protein